jgi:hypothetical protein
MDLVETRRFLGQINTINTSLAQNLKITAFDQCEESKNNLEDRLICKILSDKTSVDEKLLAIRDGLSSSDWLKFIPTINSFLKDHPISKMTLGQKEMIDELSHNSVLSGQVRNLVATTKSLLIQNEWVKFAKSFLFYDKRAWQANAQCELESHDEKWN